MILWLCGAVMRKYGLGSERLLTAWHYRDHHWWTRVVSELWMTLWWVILAWPGDYWQHRALFSHWESVSTPENHKLWQPCGGEMSHRWSQWIFTGTFRQEISIIPFKSIIWRRFIQVVQRNSMREWFWGQTMRLRESQLFATLCRRFWWQNMELRVLLLPETLDIHQY